MTTLQALRTLQMIQNSLGQLYTKDVSNAILEARKAIEKECEFFPSTNIVEQLLWQENHKTAAVKCYADRTGCTVTTAKEIVFKLFNKETEKHDRKNTL